MLQPISTLPLPQTIISQLRDNGFYYVEDIQNISESTTACSDAIKKAKMLCRVPETISALDILHEESQAHRISTLSQELDKILDGGFQCKTITELCGAPGSGKTQICFQICISVQLSKKYNGLSGETLYIDTRSGISIMRLKGKNENSQF